MVGRTFVLCAALAACGGPKAPDKPAPATPDAAVAPSLDAPVAVAADAAVAAPEPKPAFKRESLPVWQPIRAAGARQQMHVLAVDVDADWLVTLMAPNINIVHRSVGKQLSGQIYAAEGWDAFGPVAQMLGVDVTHIKPAGRGARVDFDFRAAPFRDLLRVLGDVGGVNVIVAPGDHPALNVRLKTIPWDQALKLLVERAGLSMTREGPVFYVHPPGATVKVDKRHTGIAVDLDANEATLAQIVTAVRVVAKLEVGSCSATKLSFRARRMPVSQLVKALELASGEKLADKAECSSRPLADEPTSELRAVAFARTNTTRAVVFDHKGAALVGKVDKKRITDIGDTWVSFVDGTNLTRYPTEQPRTPDANDAWLSQFVRAAALIRKGMVWEAIVETNDGSWRRFVNADVGHGLPEGVAMVVREDGLHIMRGDTEWKFLPLAPR